MYQVINDFIKSKNTTHGYGLFKHESSINHGEKNVVDFAMQVSKAQTRKYKRHQIVPPAFILYFKYLNIIPKYLEIPAGKKTVTGFIDLLSQIPDKNNRLFEIRTFIRERREQILKKIHPEMRVMFVSGEKLGNDSYKLKNKLPLDKRQGYTRKSNREVIKNKII